MKVKIYLNEGEDHFFGFRNELANDPELYLAIEWDFDDDFANPLMVSMSPHPHFLDYIWAELNAAPDNDFTNAYREQRLRSLSVGDVVVLGETAWACEDVGWKRVSTDELQNAIVQNVEAK